MLLIYQAIYLNKTFWYRVCRFIHERLTIHELQQYYPGLHDLEATYIELTQNNRIDLNVDLSGIKNYDAVMSYGCKTIATTYNNYYEENFENIIANYFIHITKTNFPVICFLLIFYLLHTNKLCLTYTKF